MRSTPWRTVWRVLIVGTIVLSLVASLAAPMLRSSPAPGAERVRVGVLGDSLTVGSTAALTAALGARGVDVHVSAATGRSIPGGLDALAALRAQGFDSLVWVVALGTNDLWWNAECACGITSATATSRIQQMLDAIGPGRYVYWVNVNRTDIPPAVAVFNQALVQAAINRPNLRIVDWYGLSTANPDWFTPDGIHLSSTGYTRRAEQIAAAVGGNPLVQSTRTLPSQLGPTPAARPPDAIAARGDRGEVVRAVQQALLNRGFAVSGGADGVFGPGTEQAVRAFQDSIGLRPTGIVTAKTAAALGVTP